MDSPKVLRDPVHNLIPLDGDDGRLILALIDTPEFQRLRRIRQLGLAHLTYPGAEHTRWAHSVGVCHVARRMLDALQGRYQAGCAELRELAPLRREILAAALLHHIGHGPFSHLFEKALPEVTDPPDTYPSDHEAWSERIIQERFGNRLREFGIDVDVVTGLINKENRENLLAKDFISSQLDADRMDYLLRDSWATGAGYGEFDLEWLLHSLRIGRVRLRGVAEEESRLCFDSRKAINVVEEYIQAREFMYVQVYIHKTTRAYEALTKNIIALAGAICNGDSKQAPQPCPPAFGKMLAGDVVTTSEYLALDDFRLWCTFIDWSIRHSGNAGQRGALGRMCNQLVHRQQPYKFIELDNRSKQDEALELVTNLKAEPIRFSCARNAFTDLAYRDASYRKSKEDEEEEDRVILFLEDQGPRPAENLSDVIGAISKIETSIYRLYYDANDRAMVAKLRADGWLKNTETE